MTRYQVGDKVRLISHYRLGRRVKPYTRAIGIVKEIRHSGYYDYERVVYIVQLPNRVRMCWASELRLIRRK